MAAYELAAAHLAQDADWARLIAAVGPCMMQVRARREPYEALVRAVAYQQLHGRAAEAILNRVLALYPKHDFPPPKLLLKTDDERLRACGLSTRKVETIRGIAEGALSGLVPTRAEARRLDDEALIERLVELRGIGRWTVEMMLMFTLGRPDIWPVDDFGVRAGYRVLKGLDEMPTRKEMEAAGLAYRPHRSVAAWYLWQAAALKSLPD